MVRLVSLNMAPPLLRLGGGSVGYITFKIKRERSITHQCLWVSMKKIILFFIVLDIIIILSPPNSPHRCGLDLIELHVLFFFCFL